MRGAILNDNILKGNGRGAILGISPKKINRLTDTVFQSMTPERYALKFGMAQSGGLVPYYGVWIDGVRHMEYNGTGFEGEFPNSSSRTTYTDLNKHIVKCHFTKETATSEAFRPKFQPYDPITSTTFSVASPTDGRVGYIDYYINDSPTPHIAQMLNGIYINVGDVVTVEFQILRV